MKAALVRHGGPLLVRFVALAAAFATQILLARSLGAAGFGTYSLAFAVVSVAVIVASRGYDVSAMRIVAPLLGENDVASASSFVRLAASNIWVAAAGLTLFGGAVAVLWPAGHADLVVTLLPMLCVLPLFARSRLSLGLLRAAGKPSLAYIPEGLLFPVLLGVGVLVALALGRPSAMVAAYAFVFSVISMFILAQVMERNALNRVRDGTTLPQDGWRRITWPIYLSALVAVMNDQLALLLVGAIRGEQEAGLFSAASRYMLAAAVVGQTLYLSGAARFAAHYSAGRLDALAADVGGTTRIATALTMAIALPMFIWADYFLGLFGPQFAAASGVLRLLILATVVNVACGPVGVLLTMTRYERLHFVLLLATVGIGSGLCVALIPTWRALGAAAAVLGATAFWNLAMLLVVHQQFRVIPLVARAQHGGIATRSPLP